MKIITMNSDVIFNNELVSNKHSFEERRKKKNIPFSFLKEEMENELTSLYSEIFGQITHSENPDWSHCADKYMAELLSKFFELLKYKENKPITKLLSLKNEIKERNKNFSSNYLKYSDEELVKVLARFTFLTARKAEWEGENTFFKWQEQNMDELKEIFYEDSIKHFREMEMELYRRSYLNLVGRWIEQKKYMVSFIMLLQKKQLFKSKTRRGKQIKEIDIRKFFQTRYKINFSKEFQKNRRDNLSEVKKTHFDFIYPENSNTTFATSNTTFQVND